VVLQSHRPARALLVYLAVGVAAGVDDGLAIEDHGDPLGPTGHPHLVALARLLDHRLAWCGDSIERTTASDGVKALVLLRMVVKDLDLIIEDLNGETPAW